MSDPPLQYRLTDLLGLMFLAAALFAVAAYGYALAAVVVGVAALGLWWRKTRGITAIGFLLAVGLAGILSSLLVLPAPPSRPPSRTSGCAANLQRIAVGLRGYYDDHGRYPPPHLTDDHGVPRHSWRVLVLPYLGHETFYETYRFDEPWNGPNNRRLATRYPELARLFRCPQAGGTGFETSYLAVLGRAGRWPAHPGGSQQPVVIEQTRTGIHWMEPRDLSFAELDILAGPHDGRAHVVDSKFAVGEMRNSERGTEKAE